MEKIDSSEKEVDYENPWIYKGEPFTEDKIEKYISFVYLITDLVTGIKYIGKKQLYFVKYRTVKKKRKKYLDFSDWKSYYSSSLIIKKLVEEHGPFRFKREIIKLCKNKSESSYIESKLIFETDAIISPMFYNDAVMCRIRSSNLKGLIL